MIYHRDISHYRYYCSALYATGNYEDGAHVDVSASGFRGGKHQKAFYDVKVFNPNAPSYHGTHFIDVLNVRNNETMEASLNNVLGKLTWVLYPLVFSTLRGYGSCYCCILQKTCFPCLSSEGVVMQF